MNRANVLRTPLMQGKVCNGDLALAAYNYWQISRRWNRRTAPTEPVISFELAVSILKEVKEQQLLNGVVPFICYAAEKLLGEIISGYCTA